MNNRSYAGAVIPELVTERLVLRALRASDFEAYAAMCADPEVRRFLGDGRPLERPAAWREMAVLLGHWDLRGFGQWALVERENGGLVGRAGLWQPEGWPGLEVGWILGRSFWGKGFAIEAARASLAHAFETVGAERVISLIRPDNTRSIRVAERLGEHYDRRVELARIVHHVYVIDRASWAAEPLRALA
jgi:RimJ/RimL family protein N-acetyltransferase